MRIYTNLLRTKFMKLSLFLKKTLIKIAVFTVVKPVVIKTIILEKQKPHIYLKETGPLWHKKRLLSILWHKNKELWIFLRKDQSVYPQSKASTVVSGYRLIMTSKKMKNKTIMLTLLWKWKGLKQDPSTNFQEEIYSRRSWKKVLKSTAHKIIQMKTILWSKKVSLAVFLQMSVVPSTLAKNLNTIKNIKTKTNL